jgi:hypothetical protein
VFIEKVADTAEDQFLGLQLILRDTSHSRGGNPRLHYKFIINSQLSIVPAVSVLHYCRARLPASESFQTLEKLIVELLFGRLDLLEGVRDGSGESCFSA